MDYDRGPGTQGQGRGPQRVVTLLTPTSSITHHTQSHGLTQISPDITNACLSRKKSLSKNALIVNFVFQVKKPKLFPQSAGKIIASDGF